MGGRSAPKPDKRIGEAALKTAELGEDYLGWMQARARTTDQWAREDRARSKDVFEPLQDQFIEEAQNYDSPERRRQEAARASADVRINARQAREGQRRQLSRMGIKPGSGRYEAVDREMAMDTGLAEAGAANMARRTVSQQGRSLRAAAVDMGSGLAVNPATSFGMGSSAVSAGAKGAMGANQAMGSMLQGMDNQRMAAWQADQAAQGQMFGAIGSIAGAAMGGMPMFSSKELKTDKKPVKRSLTKQLREMPIEDWTYKKGVADEGRHTGPYAEDWQKATGKGDGKTIDLMDFAYHTAGAVQELDKKVEKLGRQLSRSAPARSAPARSAPRKAANGGRQMTRRAA